MKFQRATLVGGPTELPEVERVCEVSNLDDKVKISYGAGYEHFSHTGEFRSQGGETLAVFAWSGRTRIAE
ncbi:DUF5988 family protein [Actinosynnema sp. NPDC059797]